MTTTFSQDIRGALQSRLVTLSGMPLVLGIPQVAWEGVAYTPRPNQPYLAASVVFASRRMRELSGVAKANRGSFQIGCLWPATARGTAEAEQLADAVVALFEPPLELYCGAAAVEILYAERAQAHDDAVFTRVHVAVGWKTT